MADLSELPKSELVTRIERMNALRKNFLEKSKKPLKQGADGMSAVVGGVVGGGIAGIRPHVFGVPTDAGIGLVIALGALTVAGSTGGDMLAQLGWGMIAGSGDRMAFEHARHWREQRAADGGNATAQQIVALQQQLNDLRKAYETPAKK